MHKMKAIVSERFGTPDVLELKQIEKPIIEPNEVLFKTYATSVNTIDIVYRSGMKPIFGLIRFVTGIRRPKKKILGFDFSGEIIEIGDEVTKFKVGDQVYGGTRSGGNAEYAKSPESTISLKPSNMSYAEAAAIPVAGLSALQGLRDAGSIQEGQNVLIYGASGGIGTYAVQLAKYYGCTVTAIASGKNEELVKSLGADVFIDYTKEDFTRKSEKYDLIYDTVSKSPSSRWKNALKEPGIFVNAGSPRMSMTRFIFQLTGNKFRKKKFRSFDTNYNPSDLELLTKISEKGKLRSIIDKSYTLEEAADAHRYYEKGHTAGKVVIKVRDDVS